MKKLLFITLIYFILKDCHNGDWTLSKYLNKNNFNYY